MKTKEDRLTGLVHLQIQKCINSPYNNVRLHRITQSRKAIVSQEIVLLRRPRL